ncbi:NAD-dependent epimerase/dehydratase family protein [Clostridium sp. HBUAS56017]|uniref:NAD-dependent epimerase/dehydratase family protein n=1 Tax=Clostridium sp. HBUAS56017 TaxID=2571128 RepID=UPI001177F65A|nr:NAD-dependent epimerase/dehydratase family protein [Clostridium sp. HBUAS56017]
MISNKKILILGGAGFIGTALTKRLYKDNEIVIADKCNFEKSSLKLAGLSNEASIKKVVLDATDYESTINLGEDFDYIIHATAILGIHRVVEKSILTIDTNYTSCKYALELARRQKNLKKFLSFSTSEVYGRNIDMASEEKDMTVGQANEARWCYAASKILSEHLINAYNREHGVPTVIIRPFNVFGENRVGSNAMSAFLFRAMLNEPITVDGNGEQIRTWCHIEDFVSGLLNALESNTSGEVYNIGNPNNSISILDLAKLIKKITDSKSEINISGVYVPDVKNRTLSIEKAKRDLGYEPNIGLEDGIEKMYLWAKKLDEDRIRELYE